MSTDSLKGTFFAECEDLLDSLSEGLSVIADGEDHGETINAIFRAVHSIKGAAGAFGLDDLVGFAHKYETVLDLLRSDTIALDEPTLHLITRSADCLADLVDLAREGSDELPDALDALTQSLVATSGAEPQNDPAPAADDFTFEAIPFAPIALEPISRETSFAIHFTPMAAIYRNGHDPSHLFLELSQLGEFTAACDTSRIPGLAEFDPDESYLSWQITLKGDVTRGQIREIFSFVDGLCTLEIHEELPADAPDLPLADPAPAIPTEAETNAPEAPQPGPAPIDPAPPKKAAQKAKPASASTLRVDPERVDRLINTVGELIINQAVIAQKLQASGIGLNSNLDAELDDYRYLAREIQEGVMAIRAQPVKPLFQRMGRIVREATDATSKSVKLITEGDSTEIDKTLVERLADPLTHIVRNAIDHGIETPETRAERGKPSEGVVRLSAAHKSGHVLIEIADDGAGINRDRVYDIALEKGLIPADAKLSDSEIDSLLFLPGFSTAKEVTNLSGRGVGMDVVKTAIHSIGGRVSISSTPGKGSLISISLPLTLAVMDGMIVKAGPETLILPLSSIVETIRPAASEIMPLGQNGQVLSVRGSFVPIVNLEQVLGLGPAKHRGTDEVPVFVLIQVEGSGSVALSVDDILDQRQIVIKSLEGNYGAIPGISAATILGDGQIALIVDADAVVQMAGRRPVPTDFTAQTQESRHGQHATME